MLIELKLLGKGKAIPGVADPDQAESTVAPTTSPDTPVEIPANVPDPTAELPASTSEPMPGTELRAGESATETPVIGRKPLFDGQGGTRLLLCTSIVLSFWYLNTSALKYLTPSRDTYGIFWPRHEWLFAHAIAGTVALLLGPFQFWPGLKQKRPMLHRAMGTLYVTSAGVGALAAFYLAFHTDFGWMYAIGLTSMAMAWIISTGLAAVAIYRGMIPQHREWMVRSYMVTFGFVMLRLVIDLLETKNIGSVTERLTFASWVCWSVPLLITEALLQGRKIFASSSASRSQSATL